MKNKWTIQIISVFLLMLSVLVVSELEGQVAIDFATTSPTCNGYTNGAATANPDGGSAPYLYFWSTGQAGQTAYNLTGGDYSVTIADANGMTATATATVTQPDLLEAAVIADGDVCEGINSSWSVTATGGTTPYVYAWSTGATTQSVSNFAAGYLSVTVTDVNGCKVITGRTVNLPLSIEVVTTDVVCFGICDASANLMITGGVGPFTYLWNTGSIDPSLPWIPAGDFSVTVTDSDGCVAIGSGTVNEPPEIILDATIIGQCADDASISVTASGGTSPVDYFWSTGSTSSNLINLSPGTYALTVTDVNDCKVDTSFIISSGVEIAIVDIINPTCVGGMNGTLSVGVTAGVPSYEYLWSNGETTPMITALDVGTYTVTVTDAAGCTATESAILVPTSDLVLELSSTPAECDGTGGTATVDNVINGTPAFDYEWGTTPVQTTQTATNLAAGFYEVMVTDMNGCQTTDNIEVEPANNLTILLEIINASCSNTNDGKINIQQVGPNVVLPLTYQWSDPMLMGDSACDLSPDTYGVTVTDATGCTGVADDIIIDFNSSIETDILWEVDTCMGDSILVTFSENSSLTPTNAVIVSWDWTFDNGVMSSESMVQFYTTSDSIEAQLIIMNSSGCVDTVFKMIVFNLLCDLYPDTLFICENEELVAIPDANCTGITTYEWVSNPAIIVGENTASPTVMTNEDVILMVNLTNSLGCSLMEEIYIEVIDTSKQIMEDEIITTQCDSTTVDFSIDNAGIACYSWIFDYPNFDNIGNGQNTNYTYSEPGVYILAIVPNLPCLDTIFKEILVSEPPSANFTVDVSSCTETVDIGLMDASLTSENITAWQWILSNGDTSSMQNPIFTFDSCQVIDATLIIDFETGCQDTVMRSFPVLVFENPPALADTIIVCAAGDTIFLNPNGNPDFDYLWTPVNMVDDPTSPNPMVIVDGSSMFSVVISDDGCGDTCTVEMDVLVILSEPLNLEVPDDVSVCKEMEMDFSATTDTPVTFVWATNADFEPIIDSEGLLDSSTINFTITDTTTIYTMATDEFGCVEVDSFLVGNYEIQAVPQDFVNVCIKDTLVAMPIANLSNVDTVTWLPDNPNGIVPLGNEIFTVQIINNKGCTLEQDIEINVQDINTDLNIVPGLDTVLLGDDIRITALSENSFVYNWSSESTLDDPTIANPIATPNETITYILEVVDTVTECRGVGFSQICVVNNLCGNPLIYVPNTFTPNGDGLNDIFYVRGFNIDEVEMIIFNRWGQKIFGTRELTKGWDGSFEGGFAPSDVYGYYLKVSCVSGGEYEQKGNVTVIR
jgi:gliding motility-associated-like protein